MRMMHHLMIARPEFRSHDPAIFGEVGGNPNRHVFIRTTAFHLMFRNRDDQVRFADTPSVFKNRRSRQVFRIPFELAALRPSLQSLHLGG